MGNLLVRNNQIITFNGKVFGYTPPPPPIASTTPVAGISYTNGLPNDWNVMKEIGQLISDASNSITANTTGAIYVNKGNSWAYKITPGDTTMANGFQYAVMGFNNYQLTNISNYGGKNIYAGLTFGMVDCCASFQMNSSNTNGGGWGICLMKTQNMEEILIEGMPRTMAQIKTPYYVYNGSFMQYSDDYMFLPAEKEVFGTRTYSPSGEASALTQYAYYKNGGSKIKKIDGSAVIWWLRSVYSSNPAGFCSVDTDGGASYYPAGGVSGTAPCFCV